MSDGGFCHYCRKAKCICDQPRKHANHTKGPWSVDSELDPINVPYIFGISGITGEPYCVCEVRLGPRAESDARLISAAPDLLEACKALQMEAAARGCGLRIADEAIEKAEGR